MNDNSQYLSNNDSEKDSYEKSHLDHGDQNNLADITSRDLENNNIVTERQAEASINDDCDESTTSENQNSDLDTLESNKKLKTETDTDTQSSMTDFDKLIDAQDNEQISEEFSLLQNEENQVEASSTNQVDLDRLLLIDFARENRTRSQTTYKVIKEISEEIWITKAHVLRHELQALQKELDILITDNTQSIHERVNNLDRINRFIGELQASIIEHEKETTRRLYEATFHEVELEEEGFFTRLRGEVENIKMEIERIPQLVNKQVDEFLDLQFDEKYVNKLSRTNRPKMGLTVLQAIILIILIAVVGVAGSLLPFPTETQSQSNARALVESAVLYQTAGQNDDASRVLDDATKLGIKDVDLLGRIGQVYYNIGEYRKAISVLEQAILTEPSSQSFRLNLARSYTRVGRQQEAIAQYEELILLNPNNITYYLELGNRYENQQKFPEAETQYQKATLVAPERYEGYYNLGQLYRIRYFDFEKAAEQYRLAIEKRGDHYLSKAYYAASLAGMQQYDLAIEELMDAINLNPEGQTAPLVLGDINLNRGNLSEALTWYQRVLDLNPNLVTAYIGLGNTYVAQEDCVNAVKAFTEALKTQPTNPEALAGLDKCSGK